MKHRTILMTTIFLSLLFLFKNAAQADTVSQLNITGGNISLNLGTNSAVAGSFTQNGALIMGQFQPAPNILPPVQINGQTFSLFTNSAGGLLPPPSGEISGTALRVDLSSLAANLTGPINGVLDIGGIATGTYDPSTGAFTLSWSHIFTNVSMSDVTLNGTISAVPLPAPVVLFATGLLIPLLLMRKRSGRFSIGILER